VKIDRIRATTAGDDGKGGEPVRTPLEHVRHALGLDDAKDARPALVYFHWPHQDPKQGKTTETLCGRVLDDEDSARWGMLFRCVQVDMAKSDEKLVELLGPGDKPSFALVAQDGTIVARIPACQTALKFQKAMKEALPKFPEYAKSVEKSLASLDASLEKARATVKAGELAEAKPLYDQLRWTKVRVGPQYDLAVKEGWDLDQRLEAQKRAK